jgi:hypothetical protein
VPRTSFRRRLTVATVAAGVLSLLLAGSPAVAAPPGDAGPAAADEKPEVLAPAGAADVVDDADPDGRQARLIDFKAWLLDQPGIAGSGYIESVNDADAATTVLLWHGSSPLQQAAIDRGAEVGVTVTIRPRQYDRETLDAAAADALDRPEQFPGFQVAQAVAVSPDYDGVIVEGSFVGPQSAGPRTVSLRAPGIARTAPAGVAAKLVFARPDKPYGTRVNDSAPYNAGGFMVDPTVGSGNRAKVCSTGFAIKQNGISFATTARHCLNHNYKAYNGSGRYGDGVVNSGDGAGRTLNSRGSKLMFDGAFNNRNGYTKKVIGYGTVAIGDKICTSGGNSGATCGIKIYESGVWYNDGFSRVSTIRARLSHPTDAAVAPGDSGGPVFVTAGSGKVRAVGMIQTGATGWGDPDWRVCPTNQGNSDCSMRVGFTLMSVIVNTIPNAALVTG